MTTIELITQINAPIERCFLLSLSVDLHMLSTGQTNEKAVAGVTSGLMKLNDTVTWRAKHFGIYQNLTSRVSEYKYPTYFVSEMVRGTFKKIHHQHIFELKGNETVMNDIFTFQAPMGIVGELFSKLVLKNYMKYFLELRNQTIKQAAEGNEWQKLLKTTNQ